MSETPAAKQRRVWEKLAPRYNQQIAFYERVWFTGGREWIGARVRGRILDVAIGTGRNLAHFDADTTVTGIDVSTAMLDLAKLTAADLARDVDLHEGDAEHLPFADESFDTVVCTLSLCNIPNPSRAIEEMRRVLVPGGQLLLLDHVGSNWPPLFAAQWLVGQITRRMAGEYLTRRALPLVEHAGFIIEESQRLKAGTIERVHAVRPIVRTP